jgi:hypothetical protein
LLDYSYSLTIKITTIAIKYSKSYQDVSYELPRPNLANSLPVGPQNSLFVLDWIGLDWIGLDWIGLDWIGLDSIPTAEA